MATYKVEIVKKYGKLHYGLWEASKTKVDPLENKSFDSIDDLLAELKGRLPKGLGGEDSVIFRSVAYANPAELLYTLKMSQY